MSKYANIEQIKEVIRTEWVRYMPMELDISLSFVFGKISEVPTIDIVCCEECQHWSEEFHDCGIRDSYGWDYKPYDFCSYGEREEE